MCWKFGQSEETENAGALDSFVASI
jgi:hypothetical protein